MKQREKGSIGLRRRKNSTIPAAKPGLKSRGGDGDGFQNISKELQNCGVIPRNTLLHQEQMCPRNQGNSWQHWMCNVAGMSLKIASTMSNGRLCAYEAGVLTVDLLSILNSNQGQPRIPCFQPQWKRHTCVAYWMTSRNAN